MVAERRGGMGKVARSRKSEVSWARVSIGGDEKRVKLLSEVRLCMGQKKANGLCCGDSESENVSIPVRQLFLVPSLFALILLGEASSDA